MIPHYKDLKNRHVLITGGASGIGAGLVEGFLLNGSVVSFIDIDQDQGHHLVNTLTGKDPNLQERELGRISFFPADLRNIPQLKKIIQQTTEEIGPIDILINNAADDQRHDLNSMQEQEWDQLMSINLKPYFFTIQGVVPQMKHRRKGVILNLSSNAYLLGLPGYPSYVTAKAGISGLTKSMARELGEWNIRVNTILPGWVMTEKQKKFWADENQLKQCLSSQCLKQTIQIEDITSTALFLASDASRMITAQHIVVDGGRV